MSDPTPVWRFRLPFDIARCMQEKCPIRESCVRWQLRKDRGARVFICPEKVGEGCDSLIDDGTGPFANPGG